MHHQSEGTKFGFTLIELLVVVAIVLVLVALLFPSFKRYLDNAGGATCSVYQRNILTGFVAYAGDNNGCLPLYGDLNTSGKDWWKVIQPYIGADKTNQYVGINWMRCPSQKDKTRYATYGVNYGYSIAYPIFSYEGAYAGGAFRGSLRLSQLPGGTMLVGDIDNKTADAAIYSPLEWPFDYDNNGDGVRDSCSSFNQPYNYLAFRHGGAANCGFVDGSVRRVTVKDWQTNANRMWGPTP